MATDVLMSYAAPLTCIRQDIEKHSKAGVEEMRGINEQYNFISSCDPKSHQDARPVPAASSLLDSDSVWITDILTSYAAPMNCIRQEEIKEH